MIDYNGLINYCYFMSTSIETLLERKKRKEAQLEKLNDNLDSLLNDNIDSYKFDSGNGSQMTKFRTIKNLQDGITKLEKELDQICARLRNSGLTNITFRRRGTCNH